MLRRWLPGNGSGAIANSNHIIQTTSAETGVETTTIEVHESARTTVACQGSNCDVVAESVYVVPTEAAPDHQPSPLSPKLEEPAGGNKPQSTLSSSSSKPSAHPAPTKLASPQPLEGAAGLLRIPRVALIMVGALMFI